jgi:hypothetical protein
VLLIEPPSVGLTPGHYPVRAGLSTRAAAGEAFAERAAAGPPAVTARRAERAVRRTVVACGGEELGQQDEQDDLPGDRGVRALRIQREPF